MRREAALGAGLVLGAGAFLAWAARGRSSQVFGRSVWRGPAEGNRVALTFDDGPSESTGEILDLLEEFGAKATFFMIGEHVERLPEVVKGVRAAGHEIGNHTQRHEGMWLRGGAWMEQEIDEAEAAIVQVTGERSRWFRAPYGVRWFGLGEALGARGMTGAMWTVIGEDWKRPGAEVGALLERRVEAGSIVCLHDGRGRIVRPEIGSTVGGLKQFLGATRHRGFEFVTLTELICPQISLAASVK